MDRVSVHPPSLLRQSAATICHQSPAVCAKRYDLNNTYDIASGSSQHVRMAGLVRSMMSNKPGQLSLSDQELNIDAPTRSISVSRTSTAFRPASCARSGR